MKKILLLVLLLSSTFKGYSYNGANSFIVPSSLQALSFSMLNNRIALDSSHKILLTSSGAGLIVFDGINYSHLNSTNSGLSCDYTKDIAVGAANQYYVASDSGLSIYNGSNWTNYSPSNSAVVSNKLKHVFTHNNVVYVGGTNGFSIFSNGNFTNFTTNNSALPNDTINAFAVDYNNDLWIATNNGLCKWNGTVLSVLTTSNSALPFNFVTLLMADGIDLWLGQGSGLVRLRNGVFQTLHSLTNATLHLFPSGSISRGPKGGILFIDYQKRQICEFLNNKITTYFLQTSFTFPFSCAHVYDVANHKLWMTGISKRFASLDFNSYHNTLGAQALSNVPAITSENCQSLDVNQINSAVLNLGDMCWDGQEVRFEVPKGSGKHAIFANSLWMGGLTSSGNLRVAAQTYRQSGIDFWPGPLDTLTASADTAKAAQYNRIWKINRQEIEDFKANFMSGAVQNGNFIPAEAILSWPATDVGNYSRNMAPFVDVNNDGSYNPLTQGDYPLIRGDQMLYWVFNDNLGIHTESDGAPMKVEVHASAYAFNNPWLTTSDSLLNYTTFYHYEIFNRSSDALDSCYLANWTDFDLGNPNDDFFGTNVPRNTVYCYNSDSVDEGNGANHYGAHPPIISSIILNGPPAYLNDGIDNNNNGLIDEIGENNRMTRSIFYKNDFSLSGNPVNTNHYYNYTAAHWKDNSPLTYGGNGFGGVSSQKFIWPDYPTVPGGWHQSNASDGRMVQSCGPFHFAAGAKVDYDFAFIFSQDTTHAYNSAAYYNRAASDALVVENWFNQNSYPATWVGQSELESVADTAPELLLFPNPAKAYLDLTLGNTGNLTKVRVFDILGNGMYTRDLNGPQKQAVRINLQSFAPGIYFIEAQDKNGKYYCAKFVKDVN